jgi:hypothetical protein
MKNFFSQIGAFLQTPPGVIIVTNAVWHIVVWAMGINFSYITSVILLGVDVVVAYYLLDRLIFFFSQFILPIQNPKHRKEIYKRVKDFETGKRGPALFIKNGRIIMHEDEMNKRGPGLIVLDTASAAVLRTDTEIKDTIGPGVKFTKGNEYIAGSVDLRPQWQYIGPTVDSEQQTNGTTRDGFEISATISIKFSVRRPKVKKPTESGVTSQYGYDEEAVRNAITREVIQRSGDEKTVMKWNTLPAYLVVSIWREYVRKFKLNELLVSNENIESGLQIIERMINKRVRQDKVEALDDTGMQTNDWTTSLEFKQLQERGLEVTEVRIHNVHFDSAMEEQIISQWNPDGIKLLRKEEKYLKEKEALMETAAREDASKYFARTISNSFSEPAGARQNPFKILHLLIKPLKEYILDQSSANSDMEVRLRKLDEIWKWLLDHGTEMSRSQEEK